jgi:hypothetical protein
MESDKAVAASFGLADISVSPSAHDFGSVEIKQSAEELSRAPFQRTDLIL